MLRTSNIVVSSSWKRLSTAVKGNLRQTRFLSSKEAPKVNGKSPSSIPSENKPPSSPPKSGGGGFGTFLFLTSTVVGGLGYVAYEKELGSNATVDFIASQPYISDVLPHITNVLQMTGLLTTAPVKPAAPAHRVKTTAEIIQESHKHDPVAVVPAIAEEEPAHSETPADTPSTTTDIDSFSSTSSLDHAEEAVRMNQVALDDAAQMVTEAVRDEANANTADNNHYNSNSNDAITTTDNNTSENTVPIHTTTSTTSHGLPEVGAEVSIKSGSATSASSREILQSAAKSSLVLRQELETLMLKDIQTMDAAALRLRVTQLATELFERLSWENMRLNHAIAQVEEELTQRYERLFAKQRQELEFEIEKILFEKDKALSSATVQQQRELEEKYASQMQNAIKAQAEGFQATLQQSLKEQQETLMEDFQSQANQHHALLRKQHNEALLQTQEKIEVLRQELTHCHKVLDSLGGSVEETFNSHSISTAILTLESILSQPSNLIKKMQMNSSNTTTNTSNTTAVSSSGSVVKAQFERVTKLAQNDELVSSIVQSLPARVQQEGAPTLSELQVRFAIMREEARKVALAPEQAPKMIGQLIGTVLANISSSPSGYIAGPGVEESLARAAFHLERGKLKEAVQEVQQMEGYAKVIAHDWIQLAEDRLLVEQALRALKADSIVRHRQFQR